MNHSDIAYRVWKRYELLNFSPAYTTILTCYGALRLAEVTGDDALYNHILEKLSPFWNGEVPTVVGHYGQYDYRWGGNAAAWACLNGRLPAEAEEKLAQYQAEAEAKKEKELKRITIHNNTLINFFK